jgi:hypothetical protein
MCKAVWVPPTLKGNASDAKPVRKLRGGAVVGGRCADVPTEDGSSAGGAWCYTVEKTCANNPKASDGPVYHQDFDFCGCAG